MSRLTARKPKTLNTRDRSEPRPRRLPPIDWCPSATAEGALTHTDWARLGWRLFDPPRGFHPSARWRS
jgi:hypothetical protein